MDPNKKRFGPNSLCGLATLCLVPFIHSSVRAQQDSDSDEDDIVELSPFEVDASGDVGYYSSQTLAGGRLNTDLKNIATSVQVVTKAFMEDVGATSLDEVLAYTTGTEVFGSMSDYQQISAGGGNDDQQQPGDLDNAAARQNPQAASRVRGMAAPTRTTNYFESSIGFDSYNASRIDINRGANSFLFGLGSPGGIVNVGLEGANLSKDSMVIDTKVSTENFEDNYSTEFSLNVNKVLIEDKLALRFAAKEKDQEFMQKPAFNDESRRYVAIQYKPFADRNITLKGNYEKGNGEWISVERNGPLETLSTFIDNPAGDVFGSVTDVNGNVLFENTAQRYVADGFGNLLKNSFSADNNNTTVGVDANGELLNSGFYNNHFVKRNGWMLVYDGTENADGLPAYGTDTGWTNNRIDPGSPTFDPYGNFSGRNRSQLQFANNPSIGRIGTALIEEDGSNDYTRWANQGLLDYEVFDFRKNLITGTNDTNSNDFDRKMLSLEMVSDDGNFGVSFDYAGENYERTGFSLSGSPRIDIDINYNLPVGPTANENGLFEQNEFGGSNPNFGRLFFYASASDRTYFTEEREALRATAFAKIDFKDKFDDGFFSNLGRHSVSVLLDDNEFNQERLAAEPLVFGNNADFHLSEDAQVFQRESSAIFYISDSFFEAFEDPNFSLSDFNVVGLDSSVDINLPEDYLVPIAYKSEGDPLTDASRTNPRGDETAEQGEYSASFRFIDGQLTRTETSSQALNLQSFFLNDHLVANLGWREDDVDIRRFTALKTGEDTAPGEPQNLAILDPGSFNLTNDGVRIENASASNFGYGLVLKTPSNLLPDGMGLSFHYGENSNFVAAPGQFDFEGNNLPGQSGTTKDYGFTFTAMNDKLVVRLTRYEGDIENDTFGRTANAYRGFTNVMSRGYRDLWEARDTYDQDQDGVFDLEFDGTDPDANKNGFLDEVDGWDAVNNVYAEGSDPDFATNYLSLEDFNAFMAAYDEVWLNDFITDEFEMTFRSKDAATETTSLVTTSQLSTGILADTADISSKGYELEVTFNPNKNLRLAFNASQGTVAISNAALRLGSLIDDMMDAFNAGNAGALRNNGSPLTNTLSAEAFDGSSLLGNQLDNNNGGGAFYLSQALNGTPTPESAEYNFRFVGNYKFTEGGLKGFNLGTAYRWTQESAIGYPSITLDDIPVVIPDVSKPYYGDSKAYADFWFGYSRKILDGKARWKVQMNIRNLFADSDPVAIQAQPDGSIARVSIPVPRQFVLTNTFSF